MARLRKSVALRFRPSEQKDDPFLVPLTLSAMGRVIEQSVGTSLSEELIQRQLNSSDATVIIESKGKPVGYYSYNRTAPDRIYWGALILAPEARRQGLGRRIVRHFEKEALASGVRTIDGHVQTANSRAIVFWLNNGYRITGMSSRGSLAIEKTLNIRES